MPKKQPNKKAKVLHDYFRYLTQAKGRKPGSVRKAENAIHCWIKENGKYDFHDRLNSDMIITFKTKMRDMHRKPKKLSPGSVMDILLQLKQFFQWLSLQPGYKSKINSSDLQYFQPSPEEISYRAHHRAKDYPTLQQVKLLAKSILINSPVDMRDRALVALLLISGIRIDAAASLTIGSFNRKKMYIDQDPKDGVRTKFTKYIKTYLINFDDELFDTVAQWFDYLLKDGSGNRDPLFPKAKVEQDGLAFVKSTELCREFISASQMRRTIKQRCLSAGLPYFNPHSFRHACVALAFESATNAQEIKAISQNLGHETAVHVINTYGQLPEKTIETIIRSLGREKDDSRAK